MVNFKFTKKKTSISIALGILVLAIQGYRLVMAPAGSVIPTSVLIYGPGAAVLTYITWSLFQKNKN